MDTRLTERLLEKISRLETRLSELDRRENSAIHIYQTPLASTFWDGDAHSNEGVSLIDLSVTFGVPDRIKAVMIQLYARDSAALGTTGLLFSVGPTSTYFYAADARPTGGDVWASTSALVPCNDDGDIYYKIQASGTNTLDAWMRVWGYLK